MRKRLTKNSNGGVQIVLKKVDLNNSEAQTLYACL